jgi:alkylhydroperoxidase family enzyme
MLRAFILHRLDGVERELGESVEYLRHMLRTSLPAMLAFAKVMGMATHRRKLPLQPWHVAHIVASRSEDCGACVQIALNQAAKDGLPRDVLQAVIDRRPADLPADLALAYRFTDAITARDGAADALREDIRARFGEVGLVEFALAIASARVFPVTKRVLGYALTCAAHPPHVPESAHGPS